MFLFANEVTVSHNLRLRAGKPDQRKELIRFCITSDLGLSKIGIYSSGYIAKVCKISFLFENGTLVSLFSNNPVHNISSKPKFQ